MPSASPPPPRVSTRSRTTAVIVACALFMQNLDSTVIATALPAMAKSFGSDAVHMNVALTAYLLSVAVFIPASGWAADRFGARSVFCTAIAVFTIGSILCGRAETLWFLIAARILQGAGGALMVPVGRLLLLRTVERHELVAVMAWLTMPALLGPVLGPPVGGLIVTYVSWHWIFDINVPIGIAGIIGVLLFIDEVKEPVRRRFDVIGLLLSGICLSGIIFGLETAGRGVIAPAVTSALVVAGVVAGGLYLLHSRRSKAPLLDLSLVRLPCFGVCMSSMMLFRIGIGAIPFLLPLMLQVGFGRTAAQSGMITFASSAGALVMKPVATRALRWVGFRDTLLRNAVLSAVLLALCAAFRPTWPAAAIYAVLLVGGFFRSLQFTAMNTLAYGDVPRTRLSAATTLYTAAQQLAATLGISAGALVLELSMRASGDTTARPWDFSVGFMVVALFPLLSAPLALLLPRDAGDDLAGRAATPALAAGQAAAKPAE